MNWDDIIIDAAATDTGMRRLNNQDSHAAVRAPNPDVWRSRGHVFMVADGMGAHAVGELASKMACENIPHHYTKSKLASPIDALTKAYKDVGGMIHGKSTANKDFEGMGTTCSTLVLLPTGSLIAHVGDSRIYRVRHGRIEQLTFDHSLVWELVRRNHLNLEQASRAVPRNVITRSLGPDPNVEVDIEGPSPLVPGDTFLLCSDGLSGHVDNPELGVFAANFEPSDASQYLLHLANLRGGNDNITVVIVRVGDALPKEASKGFSLAGLFKPKAAPTAVEERIYATADCPITNDLIDRLQEDIRACKDHAIESAWPVDWARLALQVRQADDKRNQGDLRESLKILGEAITVLGIAGRVHRKHAS